MNNRIPQPSGTKRNKNAMNNRIPQPSGTKRNKNAMNNRIPQPSGVPNNNFISEIIQSFSEFLEQGISSPKKTLRACLILSFLLGIPTVFLWGVLLIMQPEKLILGNFSVEGGQTGTIRVKEKNKLVSVMMNLSPNGESNTQWINPQIKVEKGQTITINASGKINVSAQGIIKAAEYNVQPKFPWNSPDGLEKGLGDEAFNPDGRQYLTMPEAPLGALIAVIKSSDGSPLSKPKFIGNSQKFIAEESGDLLLTVNDVWLSSKEAYLPADPTGKARDYYEAKVLSLIDDNKTIAEQKTVNWTREKWDLEILKMYNKRKKQWQAISQQRNYGLWYQDNIGSFSVSIDIKPKSSEPIKATKNLLNFSK